jgi:hypothetical protein
MSDSTAEEQGGFVSKLVEGRERFLAHIVEHALEIGQRTPNDFIRHFPPAAIMDGLRDQPTLRSQILVLTTGVKQKIAMRKSARSAGEDLQIALDEGETDAESIVALLNPDDRIRFLDHKKLWLYCIEGEFWNVGANKKHEFERAKDHVAFMLDRSLIDKLISYRDIVEGISVEELATRLPRSELGKLLKQALENSHNKTPFTEMDLLATLPPSELVKHVPLTHIWDSVLVNKVARAHRYVEPIVEAKRGALGEWLDGERKGQPLVSAAGAKPVGLGDKGTHATTGAGQAGEKPESMPPDTDVEVTDEDIRIS